MNLHRTSGQPDWEKVNTATYNMWQRLASATHGVMTPGNIITAAGLLLVVFGLIGLLQSQYWWGISLLLIGRSADLLDGWVAEATDTKSPLGELCDATADKLGTALTLIVLFIVHIAPWWVLIGVMVPHAIIAIMAIAAQLQGRRLHPSYIGKVSMATAWIGLLGLIGLKAVPLAPSSVMGGTIYSIIVVSIIMSLYAAFTYRASRA